jgi:hypothetical protein
MYLDLSDPLEELMDEVDKQLPLDAPEEVWVGVMEKVLNDYSKHNDKAIDNTFMIGTWIGLALSDIPNPL